MSQSRAMAESGPDSGFQTLRLWVHHQRHLIYTKCCQYFLLPFFLLPFSSCNFLFWYFRLTENFKYKRLPYTPHHDAPIVRILPHLPMFFQREHYSTGRLPTMLIPAEWLVTAQIIPAGLRVGMDTWEWVGTRRKSCGEKGTVKQGERAQRRESRITPDQCIPTRHSWGQSLNWPDVLSPCWTWSQKAQVWTLLLVVWLTVTFLLASGLWF